MSSNQRRPQVRARSPGKIARTPATLREAVQDDFRTKVNLSLIPGIDTEAMKRNLDLLKYSLDYAEAVVDTVREPLLILGTDLRVITANKSFYDTFKVSSRDTENKLVYELGDGQWDSPALRTLLEDILPHNTHFAGFEVEHTFPRIGRRVMILNARRIVRQVNQTEIFVLAMEDVTERRDAERKKDEFVALISHDLKNPLTGIKGYLHLLGAHLALRKDELGTKHVYRASQQVDTMIELVTQLLDAAQMRSGQFRYRDTEFDVEQLVSDTIATMQLTTQRHTISKNGQANGTFIGDKARIAQVLSNLIANAIKYSPHSKRVIVTVTREKGWLTIGVQDFGFGISKADQVRVFERFFRADSAIENGPPSVGLGLSIAKEIVDHYGGRMWVRSRKGRGSTFYFALP
jgi:signal transduction histidine kinase